MSDRTCAVLVIGGGPGGYVAAARAAELGLDTVLVDAGALGGTCLNVGCIPSKAIIHAADEFARAAGGGALQRLGITVTGAAIDLAATRSWKDGVVARLRAGVERQVDGAGVMRIAGRATILDGKTVRVELDGGGSMLIATANLVIATGSRPVALPDLPFGGRVVSSTEALALDRVPAHLAVVGAGYIGLELGTAMRKLGAAVTVVELADRILPQYDAALTRPVARRLEELGVEVLTGSLATGVTDDALVVAAGDGSRARTVPADVVLVTVGRRPALDGFGLETLDLDMDGSHLRVDDRCRTSMHGVFAIGDVTGEPMLAHRASAQGRVVAEVIAGRRRIFDAVIPEVCFTDPELVSVGARPERARAEGDAVVVGTAPFSANGRARTLDRDDGFVRVVARERDHLVIGAQAVGPAVSELSGELVAAVELGATLEDLALTVHAHPSLAEAIPEAAAQALSSARAGTRPG